ncbi:carbon monoxide dehydrogenase subunit G [Streptomyces sp. p1417]|uniref:Carbon monoxide dehydrogenase subunit G n=1 Tax=Streptomyces typhae TaxID=2681492 RepID=A0A6L6WYF4_9ACTN|nr:carbon monoxide dehydrogenase subunit G [Streptomyces typhae]MVO86538.1 carbon monoxide dehydrogenase subunit G [Streptomyces typhae]
MEHEVFVPVTEEPLREALADPERVAGAVPGLHRDADADSPPGSGRLRVRVAGHTITYRGGLRVAARDDGTYSFEGEGEEVRGSGTAKFALALRLAPGAEGGTSMTFSGTASGDGRIAELVESSPQAVEAAARRFLAKFAEGVSASAPASASAAGEDGPGDPDVPEPPAGPTGVGEGVHGIFAAEVPPPSLDPLGEEPVSRFGGPLDGDEVPAAEAAHARRTMIGRSAEEVDHAPPRGRYAPVPVPESMSGRVATLRWAAPAAAVVLASAIVAGRVLRRRR